MSPPDQGASTRRSSPDGRVTRGGPPSSTAQSAGPGGATSPPTYLPRTRTVVVCGSRDWKDEGPILTCLRDDKQLGFKILVHGAYKGADAIADRIGRSLGFEIRRVPAHWSRFGKAAGLIRNAAMLHLHQPELVLAFPLSTYSGTMHTVGLARKAGIETVVWNEDGLRGHRRSRAVDVKQGPTEPCQGTSEHRARG